MANAKQHLVIGAAGGAAVYLLAHMWRKSADPSATFDWSGLVTFSLIGAAAASLPDWLEPATHPGHRAFFHSLLTGAATFYGVSGKHMNRLEPQARAAVTAGGVGYLSHLALDAMTPAGLPVI